MRIEKIDGWKCVWCFGRDCAVGDDWTREVELVARVCNGAYIWGVGVVFRSRCT